APAAPASSSRSQPTTAVSGDPSSRKLTTILTFLLLFLPHLFPSNASAPTQLSSLPQREAESLCPALFRHSRRSLRRRELSRPPPTLGGTTSALLPLSISQSVSATFQYVLYGPLVGKVVYEWLNGVELYSMISCWSLHLLILWILRGGVHVLWSS
ncbi:hypothetical protein HN51_036098, partial [Arachis hypogaea]